MALRPKNKPSRRRAPTSRSLAKIPYFGLYVKPSSRGRTLPLTPTRNDGPIARKSREKVELLSPPPSSLSFFYFLPLFLSPHQIVWSNKSSGMSSPATCHPLIGSLGFPLSSYPYLWIFTLSSCDTCPTCVKPQKIHDFG